MQLKNAPKHINDFFNIHLFNLLRQQIIRLPVIPLCSRAQNADTAVESFPHEGRENIHGGLVFWWSLDQFTSLATPHSLWSATGLLYTFYPDANIYHKPCKHLTASLSKQQAGQSMKP